MNKEKIEQAFAALVDATEGDELDVLELLAGQFDFFKQEGVTWTTEEQARAKVLLQSIEASIF